MVRSLGMSATLLAFGLAAAACGSDAAPDDDAAIPSVVTAPATASSSASGVSGTTRDDVDCSDEGLGADEVISFTAAYYVVDGKLGRAVRRWR